MNNDIQKLQEQIVTLTSLVSSLQQKLDSHNHNGNMSQKVNFSDLFNIGPIVHSPATPSSPGTYPTTHVSIPSGGGSFDMPTLPSGTIAVTIGNNLYYIPFQ